jgi:hypothetical protein
VKIRAFISLILMGFAIEITAQETDALFLYIPDSETMSDYLNLHSYLRAWDQNELDVDDQGLSMFLNNYIGRNTLQSLLFESFLRYTKNHNIQTRVLNYLNTNNIYTNYANSLRKLYSSNPIIVTRGSDGREVLQYNYNNSEFDENINLFHFNEIGLFRREIGMLLFNNDWATTSFNSPNENIEAFFILCGGQTNALTVTFRRYSNLNKDEPETIYNAAGYTQKYRNWIVTALPLQGILSRAGADRVTLAYGLGTDLNVNAIETGTFNIYLYKEKENLMYEISYFMNFAPININFPERIRIFNLLLFQLIFAFVY